MKYYSFLLLLLVLVLGCTKQETIPTTNTNSTMYFPSDDNWETQSAASLGWNTEAIEPLKDYLIQKNTKSFLILVNGKIIIEEYFDGHDKNTNWQWNSAGKTLVGTTIGIAQQEGFLNTNDLVSKHLGTGWTNTPIAKENLITLDHLLTMTTGINDTNDLVIQSNLTYLADAGTRWSYHNVFQKLIDVTTAATKQNFGSYFDLKLKNKIGMNGFWNNGPIYKIYHSDTRSMAKFGLLALNQGKWQNEQIVNPNFFNKSTNTSQNINPAYGYFWWLNGKTSYMVPGQQTVFTGTLVPNAPTDMYAAMGAADQRIYVIPSKKMVIIRMGNASDPANPSFAVSGFDNNLWQKINAVLYK